MLLILDGNSKHSAHISSKSGISIFLGNLFTSKESSNSIYLRKRPILFHTCAICAELPSYIMSTMIIMLYSSLTSPIIFFNYNRYIFITFHLYLIDEKYHFCALGDGNTFLTATTLILF